MRWRGACCSIHGVIPLSRSSPARATTRGPEALAEACRPLLNHASGAAGYGFISGKFDSVNGFGPTCVRRFVEDTQVLGDRSPEQWQQDAFGQVEAWLRALAVRH